MTAENATTGTVVTGERADLLETLAKHRHFLRVTVQGLTDEQAAQRTTVSELCLGGLIKHVATTERMWIDFVLGGARRDVVSSPTGPTASAWWATRRSPGSSTPTTTSPAAPTSSSSTLPDLDASHPLPEAPWYEPGASWSARRVLLPRDRRDRAARWPRRHHPRVAGRLQDHGVMIGACPRCATTSSTCSPTALRGQPARRRARRRGRRGPRRARRPPHPLPAPRILDAERGFRPRVNRVLHPECESGHLARTLRP